MAKTILHFKLTEQEGQQSTLSCTKLIQISRMGKRQAELESFISLEVDKISI